MEHTARARLQIITSMAIFGTLAIFTRNISVSSGEIALYRAVMAAVLIGVYLLITKQPIPFKELGRELMLLFLSGAAMGFNWILLFEAYKYTTVSLATLSYYFAPVIVTVMSPVLFREKLTKKQLICFVMSTVGLVLITGIGDLSGGTNVRGIGFGLGAACLYATVVLLNKSIKKVSGLHRTMLQFVAAVIVLTPYVLATDGINLVSLDGLGWGCLGVLGVVHTGICYCMYFSALKDLDGQEAAILSYIDPLVAVIISVTVLHETMTMVQLLGGALILGFTIWNEKK